MLRKILYKTYKGVPIRIINHVYEELYNKRITVRIGIDSPKLDTYTITFRRKYDSIVSLLIAESLIINKF